MADQKRDDGGPAYPANFFITPGGPELHPFPGMSLRDRLAMSASEDDLSLPQAISACAEFIGIKPDEYEALIHWRQVRAKARYQYADAMLAERKR